MWSCCCWWRCHWTNRKLEPKWSFVSPGVCREKGLCPHEEQRSGELFLQVKNESRDLCRCLRRHLILLLSSFQYKQHFIWELHSSQAGSYNDSASARSPLLGHVKGEGFVQNAAMPALEPYSGFLTFKNSLPRLFVCAPHNHSEIMQEALFLPRGSAGGSRGRWALHKGVFHLQRWICHRAA